MIAIGSDHAGYEMKKEIVKYLENKGIKVIDCGPIEFDPDDDYIQYSPIVGKKVANGESKFGIVICGTGIGASIASNKVGGVRAALCSEPVSARLSREHNNANVLALGARMIGLEMAKEIVNVFLSTEQFTNERYSEKAKRLGKIHLN